MLDFKIQEENKMDYIISIKQKDGTEIKIAVPKDKEFWDTKFPYGLNFVTRGHYM